MANNSELIVKYEWLRKRLQQLDGQADLIDRELIEMEKRLPEEYVYPDDATAESSSDSDNGQ